jgi:sugar phosphate isomerase/epimerase
MSTSTSSHDGARYSRRHLAAVTLAGFAAPFLGRSTSVAAAGLQLGVQTSSFRRLVPSQGRDAVDAIIDAMLACELRQCELSAASIEPFGQPTRAHAAPSRRTPAMRHDAVPRASGPLQPGSPDEPAGRTATSPSMSQMMRRELRKWRLRMPLVHFSGMAGRFRKAGIGIGSYGYNPDQSFTDEEIDRGFAMARALGARALTSTVTLGVANRLAAFASRHQMAVAIDLVVPTPNGPRTADTADVMGALELSPFFRLAVDIGQLTTAGIDPVTFLREHRRQVSTIHLTDGRRDGSPVAWGRGDTPIREVLQLLNRQQWPIRTYVNCSYAGDGNVVEEVKRCIAYARQALV